MKRCKVLWIDDEKNDDFLLNAESNGIDITAFENAQAGIIELDGNIKTYDAVILDAYDDRNEQGSISGMIDAIHKVKELTHKHKIKCFIYTGEGKDTKPYEKAIGDIPIFKKPAQKKELFEAVKKAANENPRHQIRHKYSRVLDVCTDGYLGKEVEPMLMNILLKVEQQDEYTGTADSMLPVRKIMEVMFDRLVALNLMPKCTFNEQSRYLQKNPDKRYDKYEAKGEILDPVLAKALSFFTRVIQDANHKKEESKIFVDAYIREVKSPYLFNSMVFQLLDILLWFKRYVDSEPTGGEWKSISSRSQNSGQKKKETGEILSIKSGFGFISKRPDNVFFHESEVIGDFNELEVGDEVDFFITTDNSGRNVAQEVQRVR